MHNIHSPVVVGYTMERVINNYLCTLFSVYTTKQSSIKGLSVDEKT